MVNLGLLEEADEMQAEEMHRQVLALLHTYPVSSFAPSKDTDWQLDWLHNSLHFQHLRQLIQHTPSMLEPLLQQVAEAKPQLAQWIGQNQEQFLNLLSEVSEHTSTLSTVVDGVFEQD
jgi:hypothetical protein